MSKKYILQKLSLLFAGRQNGKLTKRPTRHTHVHTKHSLIK